MFSSLIDVAVVTHTIFTIAGLILLIQYDKIEAD